MVRDLTGEKLTPLPKRLETQVVFVDSFNTNIAVVIQNNVSVQTIGIGDGAFQQVNQTAFAWLGQSN